MTKNDSEIEPDFEADFEIINQLGLHARAATKLVQLASKFPCEVELSREGQIANGKSVMGVLLLCGGQGAVLHVRAVGPRADECISALGSLIANRFGEAS